MKKNKYKNRINVYNSSNKNNVLILYRVKVDYSDVVEQCLKALLKKMYNRKEHYTISINNAINNAIKTM
jgi:hypothetical protein